MFIVFQTAGSNATAVNEEISAQLDEMSKSLPSGTEFVTMMSSNDFLFASIHNVVETLIIAIILVVLVVYFFLQDFKSTLIPSISIIVSLIGTFACLVAAGFSLNILTLFALVLAIGTVVDDAIVVVEAVQSKFDAGYKSPYLATKDAMGDVTMAIISCTCVFMAVFIPVTFMGGFWYFLYAVRYYNGYFCRNFHDFGTCIMSGSLRHDYAPIRWNQKRQEYQWACACRL